MSRSIEKEICKQSEVKSSIGNLEEMNEIRKSSFISTTFQKSSVGRYENEENSEENNDDDDDGYSEESEENFDGNSDNDVENNSDNNENVKVSVTLNEKMTKCSDGFDSGNHEEIEENL